MPDARSPIRHHLVLYRRNLEQGRARFFSLMIERDLFGTTRLVRNWGFVGSKGQENVEIFPDEAGAAQALEAWAAAQRRKGYTDRNRCERSTFCQTDFAFTLPRMILPVGDNRGRCQT